MSKDNNLTGWFSNHPKTTGVLWTLALLWATTGSAVAAGAGATSGP